MSDRRSLDYIALSQWLEEAIQSEVELAASYDAIGDKQEWAIHRAMHGAYLDVQRHIEFESWNWEGSDNGVQ